jgi:hypothetical protein
MRLRKRSGEKLKHGISRSNLFEFLFVSFAAATAETGEGGLPHVVIDFGRIFNELGESRRPKITVANRVGPIEAGRFVMNVPATILNVSSQDISLLIGSSWNRVGKFEGLKS